MLLPPPAIDFRIRFNDRCTNRNAAGHDINTREGIDTRAHGVEGNYAGGSAHEIVALRVRVGCSKQGEARVIRSGRKAGGRRCGRNHFIRVLADSTERAGCRTGDRVRASRARLARGAAEGGGVEATSTGLADGGTRNFGKGTSRTQRAHGRASQTAEIAGRAHGADSALYGKARRAAAAHRGADVCKGTRRAVGAGAGGRGAAKGAHTTEGAVRVARPN